MYIYIYTGGNAHKLSMIQSPGKPMHVVLVIMLSWILGNHDVAVDAVIQVIQELYSEYIHILFVFLIAIFLCHMKEYL